MGRRIGARQTHWGMLYWDWRKTLQLLIRPLYDHHILGNRSGQELKRVINWKNDHRVRRNTNRHMCQPFIHHLQLPVPILIQGVRRKAQCKSSRRSCGERNWRNQRWDKNCDHSSAICTTAHHNRCSHPGTSRTAANSYINEEHDG